MLRQRVNCSADENAGEQNKRPAGRSKVLLLAAQPMLGDDGAVSLDVQVTNVIKQTTSLTDHQKKTTPGVMVTLVHLEVFVEVVDALREDGDLHLG